MNTDIWELTIIDAAPGVSDLGALVAGDIDGDGKNEIVTGGGGKLLWYRPIDGARGVITEGKFHVGLALEDIDGDGIPEIVAEEHDFDSPAKRITWFKRNQSGSTWERYYIDRDCVAGAHDLLFFDIDGDGERELIANAAYGSTWGVFLYKRASDPREPWRKYTVQTGFAQEGLAAADCTGDGRVEIISGPDWYRCPEGPPVGGEWIRDTYAPDFREMSRVATVDITGNGRPDVVICESEYRDGRLAWFENRVGEDADTPWLRHELERGLIFAHSLVVRRDDSGRVRILVGEMNGGGWWQPINPDARLIEFVTGNGGGTWSRSILYQGAGTHQATLSDIDNDGTLEIVGKEWGLHHEIPRVHYWKKKSEPSIGEYSHRFIDRDKQHPAIEMVIADVNGDGLEDVVCGKWWYRQRDWRKFQIPGIYQVLHAYDLDGDGRAELIATKERNPEQPLTWDNWYGKLSSELCVLKPRVPEDGEWDEYHVGNCGGDWPHGAVVGPFLSKGRLGLATASHSADHGGEDWPRIFEIPGNLKDPWLMLTPVKLPYGEQLTFGPLSGGDTPDLVAGGHLLIAAAHGSFQLRQIAEGIEAARVCVADLRGTGVNDIIIGEEVLDFEQKITPYSRLLRLERPADPSQEWGTHVIDKVRCPHSLSVDDIDGDGELEIVCGEHDPFSPYRSRCRLYVYKKADSRAETWRRFVLDDRFEHHNGAKIINLASGRKGIVSHGWTDSIYVHLWEPKC